MFRCCCCCCCWHALWLPAIVVVVVDLSVSVCVSLSHSLPTRTTNLYLMSFIKFEFQRSLAPQRHVRIVSRTVPVQRWLPLRIRLHSPIPCLLLPLFLTLSLCFSLLLPCCFLAKWRHINCWFYGVLSRPALWSCSVRDPHSPLTLSTLTGTHTHTHTHTPDSVAMIHWRCVVVIVDISAKPRKTYCCPLRRQNAVGATSSRVKSVRRVPQFPPPPFGFPLSPLVICKSVGNLLGLFLTWARQHFNLT